MYSKKWSFCTNIDDRWRLFCKPWPFFCRYDLFCDLADNIVSASEAIRQVLGMPDRALDEGREDPSEYNVILQSIHAKQKINMNMKSFCTCFY